MTICPASETAQRPLHTFTITNENKEEVIATLTGDSEAESAWKQRSEMASLDSPWSAWIFEFKLEPHIAFEVGKYIEDPIRINAQESTQGFFRIMNAYKSTHALRIIILLDSSQVMMSMRNKEQYYYDSPSLAPQEQYAFEFTIPPLTSGLHHLSFLLISDPDAVSTDLTEMLIQQKMFTAVRYDLWVGIDEPKPIIEQFRDNEGIAEAAGSRVGGIELVEPVSTDNPLPLSSLTVKPGASFPIPLQFFNCGIECRKQDANNSLFSDPVPVRIMSFWDDRLTQINEFNLEANVPDHLVINLEAQAPVEPGSHQLSVVVFTFPDDSQYDATPKRVLYPTSMFSRRVQVTVEER